jgi:RNA methyltransferase, TrmH family
MPLISSRQHASVRASRAILRGDDPRVILDGWHLLECALSIALPLEWVAVTPAAAAANRRVMAALAARDTAVLDVAPTVMDALSPVRQPSGVVAVAARPTVALPALLSPSPALVVAALGLQDPGNVGALIRSADAGGATGVLLDAASADPWHWKALRASMGSTLRLPVLRDAAATDTLRECQRQGLRVIATVPRGGVAFDRVDLRGPTVLLLGAEGAGLPAAALAAADATVTIPMRAGVESLNAAVAAALLVYEAARQRAEVEPS